MMVPSRSSSQILRPFVWVVWLGCIVLWSGCRSSHPPGEHASTRVVPPYLRSVHLPNGHYELQVATRRFAPRSGNGPSIWLVGVAHVGESNYYSQVQALLDQQQRVLYEGVRADDTSPRNPGAIRRRSSEELDNSLQGTMAKSLGLVFQLTAIDYNRAHFQNSDLSIPQLQRLIEKAPTATQPAEDSEDAKIQFAMLMQAMQEGSWLNGFAKTLMAFVQASTSLQAVAKLALIEVTSTVGGDLQALAAASPGMKSLLEVLVDARNEQVMRDLRDWMKSSASHQSVAVFYGAAHMQDFQSRLEQQLRYKPVEEKWLTAFSVDPEAAGLGPTEEKMVRSLVNWQLEALKGAAKESK